MLETVVAEIFYCIIGLIFILTGIKALKDSDLKERYFTAFFWFILAFTFIAGPYLPAWITGICVLLMAACTALGKVKQSKSDVPEAKTTRANADKLGYKVLVPALILALVAVLVATFWTEIGANNAIGISAFAALIVAFLIFRCKGSYAIKDGTRLMDNVGAVGILPQVLAALGSLFTAAGVGTVISGGVTMIVPEGNHLIAQGADPVVVGAMGLTAGYCGTLMTPMAANFNIMPAALLETKNKYAIIKAQVPVAATMLVLHIILMYFLAF